MGVCVCVMGGGCLKLKAQAPVLCKSLWLSLVVLVRGDRLLVVRVRMSLRVHVLVLAAASRMRIRRAVGGVVRLGQLRAGLGRMIRCLLL
jgi:hypothetical protein